VLLKPVVAGVTNITAATLAALVTSDTIRDFLEAISVDAADGSTDAKASVVRVICVRSSSAYGITRSRQQGISGFREEQHYEV